MVFHRGSRYADVREREFRDAEGRTVRHKAIRFIPPTPPTRFHRVQEGDRLDNLAWRHHRDPERFWRIADANDALWPDDLTKTPGDRIGIPEA